MTFRNNIVGASLSRVQTADPLDAGPVGPLRHPEQPQQAGSAPNPGEGCRITQGLQKSHKESQNSRNRIRIRTVD